MDPTVNRIDPLYIPPRPPSIVRTHTGGEEYQASGLPSSSETAATLGVTQIPRTVKRTDETVPPPTYTANTCSITLCSNSSTQRYPATRFGVLEIRREQNGITTTDHELLVVLRKIYYERLRPPFQRLLSVRGLKHIVIVECTSEEYPVPMVMNASLRRDLIHVFNKPNLISTKDRWVNLICDLGDDPNHDYGLLFVDDWDAQKISVLVGVPWVVSIITAILWIAKTGDIQNAMAVSSYILSAIGVVVGLLAVLGTIET